MWGSDKDLPKQKQKQKQNRRNKSKSKSKVYTVYGPSQTHTHPIIIMSVHTVPRHMRKTFLLFLSLSDLSSKHTTSHHTIHSTHHTCLGNEHIPHPLSQGAPSLDQPPNATRHPPKKTIYRGNATIFFKMPETLVIYAPTYP